MNRAVRDCLITGYQPLIESLTLPDPDDRHVLAAAIKARDQVIVTSNLSDFPADAIRDWDIEAKSPDEFVLGRMDISRETVYGALQQIAASWAAPAGTIADVLTSLERDGLLASVAALRP